MTSSQATEPDIVLTLRPQPVEGVWPVAVRLRLLLKRALRDYKLKCIHLADARTSDDPQEETHPAP
jgi:hypothetical protein